MGRLTADGAPGSIRTGAVEGGLKRAAPGRLSPLFLVGRSATIGRPLAPLWLQPRAGRNLAEVSSGALRSCFGIAFAFSLGTE